MEPPANGKNLQTFKDQIKIHVEKHYNESGSGYECRNCGSVIRQMTCHVSVHNSPFKDACVGEGRVVYIQLPYCPDCEGMPQKFRSCVHE